MSEGSKVVYAVIHKRVRKCIQEGKPNRSDAGEKAKPFRCRLIQERNPRRTNACTLNYSHCSPGLDNATADSKKRFTQRRYLRPIKYCGLSPYLTASGHMRIDLNLLAKMVRPHGNVEYKNLLDIKGEPSLEGAESHQTSEPLRAAQAKSFNPRNVWIFHLAMVTLYSTIFILITWMRLTQHFHGPGLIFCMSGLPRLQKRS